MTSCPYGSCSMRNLCKGSHCVRKALEDDGFERTPDGDLRRKEEPK